VGPRPIFTLWRRGNLFPLAGIETRFIGRRARNLDPILIELPRMNKRRVEGLIYLRLSRIKFRLLIVILSRNLSPFLFNSNLVFISMLKICIYILILSTA
jgi:hypothetical protein